jgi:signal transduction histidine kinase
MNGFNSFYPDSLQNNPYIPEIAFTSAYTTKKGQKEFINLEKNSRVVLPWNDNSLTVEFSVLEFSNPSRNRYMYRLAGTDEDWIDIGQRRFVAFSGLSPGEYTLQVKGSNNDGVWNEKAASFSIQVKPPLWASNLAYLLYLLIIMLIVFGIIKHREQQHARDKKLLEDKVTERTLQIEEQKTEILKKNAELHDLNASKDKFFSIIAHDLRNPFNTIIGLTDLLLINLESDDRIKLQKGLENIKGSSRQAYELLENLLMWARSQTGTLTFRPEKANLKDLAEESLDLVSAQAARKNITINADQIRDIWSWVDVNMIRTVLRNLLTNAIKFTPQNGYVTVGLTENEESGIVTVQDNGIGMEKEKLSTLFNMDTSHKTKGTDKEPGTGLGLILCKEFIERHGGSLEVESEPGKGSKFRVVLPKKPVTPDEGYRHHS